MADELYYHAGTLGGVKRSVASIVETTTAGRFDSAFADCGIDMAVSAATDFIETTPFIDAASTTTLWSHGEWYNTSGNASLNAIFMAWLNSSGQVVVRIRGSGASSQQFTIEYWNGSTFTAMTTFGLPNAGLNRIDARLTAGAGGTFDLFFGGAQFLPTLSGMNAAVTNYAAVRHGGTNVNGGGAIWSQMIGANFDTRDLKYRAQLVNGDGADTDGTGSSALVDEMVLDDSDAIVLPAVGNKRTFTKPTLIVPSGYEIAYATFNARARVAGGTVADGKHVFRSAGTDYSSSARSYNGGYEPRGHHLAQDPATSAAWTPSGYNSMQPGLEAS